MDKILHGLMYLNYGIYGTILYSFNYHNLLFCRFLIVINPNAEFIVTLQKIGFDKVRSGSCRILCISLMFASRELRLLSWSRL